MVSEDERVPFFPPKKDSRKNGSSGFDWSLTAESRATERSPRDTSLEENEKGTEEMAEGTRTNFSFSRMSSRKKATFVQVAFANFGACTCFSLLAPFFPAEAMDKDMPETLIGLVFSSFVFCIFAFSPIYGSYMAQIGPRFAFIAGQFLAGGCSILFGLLYLSPPGVPFIALCFALRIVKALGAAAYVTASFTIIANEFPEHVATAFGALETFSGLGYVVGPLLGGVLYEAGGFGLPFFLMGGLLILCSVANHFTLAAEDDSRGVRQKRRGSMLSLLKSPLILVSCLCVVLSTYTFGFMDASFAIHLEQFHLSTVIVGVLFMIVAALYSISSPMFGWMSDRKNIVFPFLIIGSIVNFVALLLIGPSPLLPFEGTEMWMIVVSLILLGFSVGAASIPALKCFYIGARRLGFQNGLDLDGLVAGLLSSAFHFGTFLGPTIGSPVMQAYGYEWSVTLNGVMCLFAAILLGIYLIVERMCLHYDENKNITDDRADTTLLIESSKKDTYTANTSTSLLVEKTEDEF